MLRDQSLIPLSHQHQHTLALCVRINRSLNAGEKTAADWLDEVTRAFADEIRYHFDAEEKLLFPAAEKYPHLVAVVKLLRSEHGALRGFFQRAEMKSLDEAGLRAFVAMLSRHVRTEERELFEGLEAAMNAEQLAALGRALDEYFAGSGMPPQFCPIRTADGRFTTEADEAARKTRQ